jgi:imidazolonepropionase
MPHDTIQVDYIVRNARVLTLAGEGPRHGAAMDDLGTLDRADVAVRAGRITHVGTDLVVEASEAFDADGRVLMPGLVDCHTHACWAGVRYDELDRIGRGESYLDILASGGGIMATVRAVRAAAVDELAQATATRLRRMSRLGATTIECKSGYGLTTASEVKMLRAIEHAGELAAVRTVPTALVGHAIDNENPRFIDETIEETVPAVAEACPGVCLDAYCEQGAWSREDTLRLFRRGWDLGLPIRVHADQFNSLGMVEAAIEMQAWSVDHLEASTDDTLAALSASSTLGVMLPVSAFHLNDAPAPGRKFIDMGGALAIATNFNPGTGPSPSLPFAMSLAVKQLKLTPAEAIAAATINAAHVLRLHDLLGSIEVGKIADMILLDSTDERLLVYEIAGDPIAHRFMAPLW